MDHLRLSAVVARVVAWHNRHPLARRIGAAQVHGVGYVALPFTGPAPQATGPSAAAAAAEAIAAAAAAAAGPLPVLTETAETVQADAAPAGPEPAGPERSRLRERALARARELATLPPGLQARRAVEEPSAAVLATLAPALLKADFSEDFIDPLTPRQVARFALKHGSVLTRLPLDGPVREVQADSLLPGRQVAPGRVLARVLLLTAVVETDTRKSRVLLGGGLQPEVLGRRIHSTPRLAALAALGVGVVGLPLWVWRPLQVAPASPAEPARAVADAPAAPAAPEAVALAPAGAAPASAAASASAPSASAAASASASASAPAGGPAGGAAADSADVGAGLAQAPGGAVAAPPAARSARTSGVSIVPPLTEEAKARAREERAALMPAPSAPTAAAAAEAPAAAPGPAAPPAPAPAPAPVPAPAAAPAPAPAPARPPAAAPARAVAPVSGPVFAITTRPLRTRAEADQVRVAMLSLLRTLGHEQVQVEVLPQGDDWRVVALPFSRRAEAERGRSLLASRGMRVEVVDF